MLYARDYHQSTEDQITFFELLRTKEENEWKKQTTTHITRKTPIESWQLSLFSLHFFVRLGLQMLCIRNNMFETLDILTSANFSFISARSSSVSSFFLLNLLNTLFEAIFCLKSPSRRTFPLKNLFYSLSLYSLPLNSKQSIKTPKLNTAPSRKINKKSLLLLRCKSTLISNKGKQQ